MQFDYAQPQSMQEVCELLTKEPEETKIYAGGQSLLPLLRDGTVDCKHLIDISQLSNKQYIIMKKNGIRIGCLTRHVQVVESDTIQESCSILANAVGEIADMQVRNQGTICGSIAHAEPSADPPVIAVLLGAEIVSRKSENETVYDARGFFEDAYTTRLDSNEIITEVRFPIIDSNQGTAYNKWHPSEVSYAVASVGVTVTLENEQVTDATIVTGAIEPTPTRRQSAANLLIGSSPTNEKLNEVANSVAEVSDPVSDFEGSSQFKSEMIKTLTKRTVNEAVENAR